jgi:hypothetical protein
MLNEMGRSYRMPNHIWLRLDTKGTDEEVLIEVIRKIEDYALPPQEDEYPKADEYEWEKSFKGAKTTIVGFGQKGYWLYLFAIIGEFSSNITNLI